MATRTQRGTRTPVPKYDDAANPFLQLATVPDGAIYPSRLQINNESAVAQNLLVKTEAGADERLTTTNDPAGGYELKVPGGVGVIIDNIGPGRILVSADTAGTLITWALKFQTKAA